MIKYSVKKPYTVLVAVVLAVVLGVISFINLKTDLLPTIELPYVMVITTSPGASPERVEMTVTKPLEQALATTTGLENMTSISQENSSLIILELSQSINMDSAMLEISGNIDLVKGYLGDTTSAPMIIKLNPDMLPIQVLSVDMEGMDIKELTAYVENTLVPQLERIDGVATVDVSGGVENFININLNQDKIDDINLSILNSIDSNLAQAQVELNKGKNELVNGKQQLLDQKNDLFDQLASASSALDQGQAKLQAITSQSDLLSADIEVYNLQKQLLNQYIEVSNVIQQLQGAVAAVDGLNTTLSALEIDGVNASELPFSTLVNSDAIPSQIKMMIQGMLATGAITPDATSASSLASLNGAMQSAQDGQVQLKNALIETGLTSTIIDNQDVAAIDTKINDTNAELKKALAMKNQMQSTVDQLAKSYQDLELAKMQAVNSLTLAEMQLTSGEQELNKAISEFETAKQQALSQANIDSLVNKAMLSNILQAQNFSMPAGYINVGNSKITVKVGDTINQLDELENLLLVDMNIDGVDPIYLSDVADIVIMDNADESFVRINGNEGVVISFQKSSVASTSVVSDKVNLALKQMMANDANLHITTLMDQGIYIKMVTDSVMQNLIYGGIIAFLILLFFLKDLRPTLVIGLSIPLSLLVAIVLMYFSNVSLNIISLSGLALAVGMLVDNSIVVIENIYRLSSMGYSKRKAAIEGAAQVGGAIFASTLTTICVFLPIVFTQGISRQLFTDMGLTIAYALLASLIVAMTFVPCMASTILSEKQSKKHNLFDKFVDGYTKLLTFNLKHKSIVIMGSLLLLGISIFNVFKMPMSFMPEMDSTQMTMTLNLGKDVSDSELQNIALQIAGDIENIEDVETVALMSSDGGGMAMMSSSNDKTISYYVVLNENKTRSNQEIADEIMQQQAQYADNLSISTSNMNMSALGGSGIQIAIKGSDLDQLQTIASDIAAELLMVEGVASVDDQSESLNQELRIDIDKEKAMQKGFTTVQVFQIISEALKDKQTSSTFNFGKDDMVAYIIDENNISVDNIATIIIKEDDEQDILLQDIATIYQSTTPNAINRDNQARTQTISAILADGYNVSLVSRDVAAALKDYQLPYGYTMELIGENETIISAMRDLLLMISLAVVFIYLIMVAQFQSLLSPFIVIFTIPLAFTGGLLGLQLTNSELSVVSMIGFLVLSGVVVNNGIVFVDYVNQLRLSGMDKKDALIMAGRDRIRPILMTAITTILAMSTMALGVGMGADMSQGMAIVTIGGLTYATILTLFLVPALYDIFHRKNVKYQQWED